MKLGLQDQAALHRSLSSHTVTTFSTATRTVSSPLLATQKPLDTMTNQAMAMPRESFQRSTSPASLSFHSFAKHNS